jgi:filamentous hemagglutinin family protein
MKLKFASLYFLIFLNLAFEKKAVGNNIVPDNTLSQPSSVNNLPNYDSISGGTTSGSSLFHSFLIFNIGKGAYFNNPININNILVRVTGSSPSTMNGLLGVNGTANLFFMNPNGVIFGRNARLNLNGSFLVTTADSIKFNDYNFSSISPKDIPTIDIGIPQGLIFDKSIGSINVQNDGYAIYQSSNSVSIPPTGSNLPDFNLAVKPGNNLTMVANGINFQGGVVNVIDSDITLVSIQQGEVKLNNNLTIDPKNKDKIKFQDISLRNNSFISDITSSKGNINIFGDNIHILDGSSLVLSNFGLSGIEGINIFGEGDIYISGSPDKPIPSGFNRQASGIFSLNFSNYYDGSPIKLKSKNTYINNSGVIGSGTFSNKAGGNIELSFEKSLILTEDTNFANTQTTVSNFSASSGAAGNTLLTGGNIVIKNGASVASQALSSGNAGDISIQSNSLDVNGYNNVNFLPSNIISLTANSGDSGAIFINSNNTSLLNGGRIESTTLSSGNAGSVNITAQNILVSGTYPNPTEGYSIIGSSATQLNPLTAALFSGFSLYPTGNAGSVNITSSNLTLTNGGQISVRNFGSGNSGNSSIKSNRIIVNDGTISGTTNGGDGGNINLIANATVLRNSTISASAGGSGNGGNIDINTTTLASDRESSITANADRGDGGNINIMARGRIGKPNISASSKQGISGEVRVDGDTLFSPEHLEVGTTQATEPLPVQCDPNGNAFIAIRSDMLSDEILDRITKTNEIPKFVDEAGKLQPLLKVQGLVPTDHNKLRAVTSIPINAVSQGSPTLNICQALSNAEQVKRGQ